MDKKEELDLVRRTAQGDEEALKKLVLFFRPLIKKIKQKYHLPDFDENDWEQEALMTCYKATLTYQKDKGRFVKYYQRQLTNRVHTIMRSYMAECRRGYLENESLENLLEKGNEGWFMKRMLPLEHSITEISTDFCTRLSRIELISFNILIGKVTNEEAKQKWHLNDHQLGRARCRVYHKLRDCLL